MMLRRAFLAITVAVVATAHAEFTPSGARQVFGESPESLRGHAHERGGYVFIPADWVVSGNMAKDKKAELVALRNALTGYLAEATGQSADKIVYDLKDVKSTTVRTFMKKRQRYVVTAYDADPIRAYTEEHRAAPLWKRIVLFWRF